MFLMIITLEQSNFYHTKIMKTVIVASKNPVKINAAKVGFEKMFPWEVFECRWVSVASWVSDQPMSQEETIHWARNRIREVRSKYPDAEYWVGIEWWIEKKGAETEVFAWIIIESQQKEWRSQTATFYLPELVTKLIDEGKELGEANDIFFSQRNSKQKWGMVWKLTDNLIDRTEYYVTPMILALIPFRNSDLY